MRDISVITVLVAIVLGSIGFAVPASSERTKRYRAILWGIAGAFLAFNILLWRSTSLDVAQYGSCLLDASPKVCAPVRGEAPKPESIPAEVIPPGTASTLPFPIAHSWAGPASTEMPPPSALPKQLGVRIYRENRSDELLLRFGECVERMQLVMSGERTRIYSTNTDLTLSGGWGKYPWPCWYSDWVEKLNQRDNRVTLSYMQGEPQILHYERIGANGTDANAPTVYKGRLTRD